MKKAGKINSRIMAGILILIMVLGNTACIREAPDWTLNEDETEVSLTELEEMPEPTVSPAKGYIGIKVADDRFIDSDGKTSYAYRETYLPVVTDEDHIVYGKLDSLCSILSMESFTDSNTAVVKFHGNKVYMKLRSSLFTYQSPLFSVNVAASFTPVKLGNDWYVPLDSFLDVTGTYHDYIGETSVETEQLCLIPPQETVLDVFADFYKNMYHRYAFDYLKDIGYTEKVKENITAYSKIIQYVNGIGSLDSYTWGEMIFRLYEEEKGEIFNKKYVDNYMKCLLQPSESELAEQLNAVKKVTDAVGAVSDLVMTSDKYLTEEKMTEIISLLQNNSYAPKLTDYTQLMDGWEKLDFMEKIDKPLSSAKDMLGYYLSYRSLKSSFENANSWFITANKNFLDHYTELSKAQMTDVTYRQAKEISREISSEKNMDVSKQWFSENWMEIMVNSGALLGSPIMGELSVASSAWTFTTNLFYGHWLDASESYLNGLFGIQYETDVMMYATQKYLEYFSDAKKVWTKNDEFEFRYLFSDAAKSCYVTRQFGLKGCEDNLIYYPGRKAEQERINKELEEYIAVLSDFDRPFGLMPQELVYIGSGEQDHYPNVVFNIAELTGQVLRWDDEQPAKNVRIEIHDEDGTVLEECYTDRDGMFDVAFVLGDQDVFSTDEAAIRDLNLHLYYKKYPVVMELAEDVQCYKKYQIDGLHVGEKSEEHLVYLTGARTEGDKTILLVQEIDLGENPIALDVPDYVGGTSYTAYLSSTGEINRSDTDSYLLRDGVTFGSIYTAQIPEGGFLDGLLTFTNDLNGAYPEDFKNSKMHNADEIISFITHYREYVYDDPVYVITTVNSEIKALEPSMVNPK